MRDLRAQTPESLEEIRKKWVAVLDKAPEKITAAKKLLPNILTEHIHTPESWAMTLMVAVYALALVGLESKGKPELPTGMTLGLKIFTAQAMREVTVDFNVVDKKTIMGFEEKFVENLMPEAPQAGPPKEGVKVLKMDKLEKGK